MGPRTNAIFDFNFLVRARSRFAKDEGGWKTVLQADNLTVALAGFEASLSQCTNSRIELLQKTRFIRGAVTGGYDSKTQTVPLLERIE